MARSDLVKRLFQSYARGDDAGFRSAAAEIVDDERRKNHGMLARELDSILSTPASTRAPGASTPLSLRPLPKARDDRPLLRLTKPDHSLTELVLDDNVITTFHELIKENQAASLLAAYALRPRQRLLFVGPPGTGKSASAHAIAAELSLPVAVANLAAITSSYLGDTARNLEAIIGFAETQPCVLLLDEFDTLAKERSDRDDHGELKRVVATVLQLLEDFRGESVLIATSNHAHLLDEAIWRRFDEVVVLDLPTRPQVRALIELKVRATHHRLPTAKIAATFVGASQADIERACYSAIRRMVLAGESTLTEAHLQAGIDQINVRKASQERIYGRRSAARISRNVRDGKTD